MNMMQIFKKGDELAGYCNGYFGRGDYEDKTCILVTPYSAVFQRPDKSLTVLNYPDDKLFNTSRGWITSLTNN